MVFLYCRFSFIIDPNSVLTDRSCNWYHNQLGLLRFVINSLDNGQIETQKPTVIHLAPSDLRPVVPSSGLLAGSWRRD